MFPKNYSTYIHMHKYRYTYIHPQEHPQYGTKDLLRVKRYDCHPKKVRINRGLDNHTFIIHTHTYAHINIIHTCAYIICIHTFKFYYAIID